MRNSHEHILVQRKVVEGPLFDNPSRSCSWFDQSRPYVDVREFRPRGKSYKPTLDSSTNSEQGTTRITIKEPWKEHEEMVYIQSG